MSRQVIPIVLSGGSGTRLWPLSTPERPKQFLPLVSERTMIQETLLRLDGLAGIAPPIVVCNEAHRFLVAEQLRVIGVTPQAIVLEPAGRNTAPAVAAAALIARQGAAAAEAAGDGDPVLLVLPADHVIRDAAAFRAAVQVAVRAAGQGQLVTFGIVPAGPETGYGYIRRAAAPDEASESPLAGASGSGWWPVERFVEKPDLATAERYVASDNYLWNSGMFVFGAGVLLGEICQHEPPIASACERAVAAATSDDDFTRLGAAFLESPSNSIDYAVMEKTGKAAVVPLDAGWSDVGSWEALRDVLERDSDGNTLRGDVIDFDSVNSFVTANGRLIATIGLDNIAVIDTDAGLLVMNLAQSQRVKDVVEALKARPASDADAG